MHVHVGPVKYGKPSLGSHSSNGALFARKCLRIAIDLNLIATDVNASRVVLGLFCVSANSDAVKARLGTRSKGPHP